MTSSYYFTTTRLSNILVSTETSTNTSSEANHAYHNEWMVSVVLSSVLLAWSLYFVINLSVYEYRVIKKNKEDGCLNRKREGVITDSAADRMRWLCLVASVLLLFRFSFELLEVEQGQKSVSVCNPTRYVKAVLQCGAITCIYLVLWMRQRKIYSMPSLEHLCSKAVRFFSASVVVIMAIANILTISLYLFTRGYRNSPRGCVLAWTKVWSRLPGLLLLIFTLSFQVILLGLLIYPLYKHGRSTQLIQGKRREMVLIRRVTIAATVAVATTAFVSLLSITVLTKRYGSLRQLVYGMDTCVSLLSIIFSFKDWKARLFAFIVEDKNIVGTVKRKQNVSADMSETAVSARQTT